MDSALAADGDGVMDGHIDITGCTWDTWDDDCVRDIAVTLTGVGELRKIGNCAFYGEVKLGDGAIKPFQMLLPTRDRRVARRIARRLKVRFHKSRGHYYFRSVARFIVDSIGESGDAVVQS